MSSSAISSHQYGLYCPTAPNSPLFIGRSPAFASTLHIWRARSTSRMVNRWSGRATADAGQPRWAIAREPRNFQLCRWMDSGGNNRSGRARWEGRRAEEGGCRPKRQLVVLCCTVRMNRAVKSACPISSLLSIGLASGCESFRSWTKTWEAGGLKVLLLSPSRRPTSVLHS